MRGEPGKVPCLLRAHPSPSPGPPENSVTVVPGEGAHHRGAGQGRVRKGLSMESKRPAFSGGRRARIQMP